MTDLEPIEHKTTTKTIDLQTCIKKMTNLEPTKHKSASGTTNLQETKPNINKKPIAGPKNRIKSHTHSDTMLIYKVNNRTRTERIHIFHETSSGKLLYNQHMK